MKTLIKEITACQICSEHLEAGPRPVFAFSKKSRIAIIGQAPGRRVHESGIAWHDKSGDRLRDWLGIDEETFYDSDFFAIVPMGFCYPGTGKSGDLPPRPECAPQWHDKILGHLADLQLTLLIGSYAQQYYLGTDRKKTLTETVQAHDEYWPQFLPIPHPSPRNNIWLKKNPWFDEIVLPKLKNKIAEILLS